MGIYTYDWDHRIGGVQNMKGRWDSLSTIVYPFIWKKYESMSNFRKFNDHDEH